ncbi:hypothetical protein CC1G_09773 [Coprinopsis cinerea okayama7|uniref:F-box domain-containing protein n=1 Tax=Coprinopsis cinerea (strain Okayama-7 / 130 / ATCC MYA-4618 / FGSC 9003) TaxID=240176 RepID=A8PE42_COPC7|nr:hypothetical protein CC1G_09773 [Coprinopsis cinerea okayama7\|eukprot:XP_001840722.1 hypothetical protein CC1G_09773 [Coprinopsis cinerea okayama7\
MTDTIVFRADSPITTITPILLCLDSSATEDQISRIVSPFLRTGKTSLVFKGLFEERNIRPFSLEERIPLHAISRGCTSIDIDFRQKQVRSLMYRFMKWNIDFITNATNMRQLTVRLPTTWRYHLSPEDVLALAKLPLLQELTLEGCISPFEDFDSLDGFVEQLERAFSSKAVPLRVCRLPRIASTAPGADEPAPQLGFWALTVLAECLSDTEIIRISIDSDFSTPLEGFPLTCIPSKSATRRLEVEDLRGKVMEGRMYRKLAIYLNRQFPNLEVMEVCGETRADVKESWMAVEEIWRDYKRCGILQ